MVVSNMHGLMLAAGHNSKSAASKPAGPPTQTQQPAPKPFGVKVSKQAAVASMFRTAKPAPLAGDVGESGDHAHGSMAPDFRSLSKSTEDLQDGQLAATADTLSVAEAGLSCGRAVSGIGAEREQSSVVALGARHNDRTGCAETHNRADLDRSEQTLQHAAIGPFGEQQGRSTDAASEGHALHSINLAEQKQILHELWLEKNALSARGPAKRPATASKMYGKRPKLVSGNSRQTQISTMLKKPP